MAHIKANEKDDLIEAPPAMAAVLPESPRPSARPAGGRLQRERTRVRARERETERQTDRHRERESENERERGSACSKLVSP